MCRLENGMPFEWRCCDIIERKTWKRVFFFTFFFCARLTRPWRYWNVRLRDRFLWYSDTFECISDKDLFRVSGVVLHRRNPNPNRWPSLHRWAQVGPFSPDLSDPDINSLDSLVPIPCYSSHLLQICINHFILFSKIWYWQSRPSDGERPTRHKRQHRPGGRTSSFILTDFVGVPNPEADVIRLQSTLESGIWSEWSEPSECSRTCGGGVSTQTRECLQRGWVQFPKIKIHYLTLFNMPSSALAIKRVSKEITCGFVKIKPLTAFDTGVVGLVSSGPLSNNRPDRFLITCWIF